MIYSQVFFNALIAGSIVALVAAGFSLIYSTNKFAHFAHGAVVAAAGYMLFLFVETLQFPFVVAAFLTILLTGLLGLLLFFGFYRPLKKKNSSSVILLIASIGLMILIENMLLVYFGASVKRISVFPTARGLDVLGAVVTPVQIAIIVTALVLLLGLFFFTKYMKLGKLMRAVADNPELAEISGMNTTKIQAYSFFLGSALAGIAGILIAIEQNLLPSMGTNLIVRGFTGAVIGGVSSIPGAFLGSYVLGFVENFGILYLPSEWKEAIAFLLLLFFLLFRPNGILGIHKGTRQ